MATMIGIKGLLQDILARIATFAAGETWATAAGDQVPLNTHLYRLPNTSLDKDGVGPYPYIEARPANGSEASASGRFKVRLTALIYNSGDDGEGDEDIERILEIVLKLPLDQDFSPFALDPEIEFKFGVGENGEQPHPVYTLTADLWFTREAVHFFQ